MKVIMLILVSCLLSVSFASRTQKQQALFSESLLTKLRGTNLGRAVLLLAEVHSKQSKVNFNKLFDALDELGHSLQSRISLEDQDYTKAQGQQTSDHLFYSAQVDQYSTEVAQLAVDIRALTSERINLESTLQTKKNELSQTNREKQLVQNQMMIDNKIFNDSNDELNEAITIIDQALGLLSKAKSSSFIETNHELYHETAARMTDKFSKQQGHYFLYQPIAKLLVQVTSSDFADQQNLGKVLTLLQGVRDSFNDQRLQLGTSYQNSKEENQKIVDAYTQKATLLLDTVIAGLQQDVENLQGQIVTKQSVQNEAQANLDGSQSKVEATDGSWELRTSTHNNLIQEFAHELEILGECVQALNGGGINRTI